MGILSCPVRGCGEALAWEAPVVRCPRGHAFDRARSGYVNLLQPQDKRSRTPGDSRATTLARRRSLERGLGDQLREAVQAEVARMQPQHLLDAGCGEGFFLRALAGAAGERWGVDLSAAALEHGAARDPAGRYVVANADRRLPFFEHVFKIVLTLTGPKAPDEFARLIEPDGRLLVAVPDDDDLLELRQALLGRATALGHAAAARARFERSFELLSERRLSARQRLDAPALADLLATSYRGARVSQRERLLDLPDLEVTTSHVLLILRPRR
jgi:23S rRNA (guanine745-N1)-methyltransferase